MGQLSCLSPRLVAAAGDQAGVPTAISDPSTIE